MRAVIVLLLCIYSCFPITISAPVEHTQVTQQALSYMAQFGYYTIPDGSIGVIANEKTIRLSIQKLQRYAGLEPSGIMDTPTKELLKTPRCGLPDMSRSMKTRKRRYTLQGTVWKHTKLTWKLVNDNNDGLSREKVEGILELAFSKWQAKTNLEFRKLHHNSLEKVDIEVKFASRYHQDPYPFDGRGGTLAHAFYPHNNGGLSGDVHFDDDEQFTVGTSEGRNLLWVAVHEIGHSIGLEHSNVRKSIMFPWYQGYRGDFVLNEDDIVGIQSIYGSRVTPVKTTTKTSVTNTATSPKKAVTSCVKTAKSVFMDKTTETTYMINDDKVYILDKDLSRTDGPFELTKLFPDLANFGIKSVDAVYKRIDRKIVMFKGLRYLILQSILNPKVIEEGSIFDKYRGINPSVKKIDAAFVWSGNGRTYLFSGEDYYRYNEYNGGSMDFNYPKKIVAAWKGVPANIDSVFVWKNGVTYFFKGTQYHRLNNKYVSVEHGYPKFIAKEWTQCSSSLLGTAGSSFSLYNNKLQTFIMSLFMVVFATLLD